MAVYQELSVTEVADSQSIEDNSSKVNIVWTSKQSGESRNGYKRTAYYYVSINEGEETEYSVSYTLPQSTTKTIVDATITVPHKEDGSATVAVRTWMDTGISVGVVEKSQTLTLTTISRASQPSCITYPNHTRDVGKFGDTITIHMNRKSNEFTHDVYYSFGSEELQEIASNVVYNTTWTIPLDIIEKLESQEKSGIGEIIVKTYTDNGNKYIGENSCEFFVTVPEIEETKPTISMSLMPIGAIPSEFAGLYLQGFTKVKATLTADGKYGADINSLLIKVDGVIISSDDDFTSSYLTIPGEKTVYGYVIDSRGFTNETSQTITVIPYSDPKLEGASAVRCDENGNQSESGTHLKISGKRSYSPCIYEGEQNNHCKIEYRYSQDKINYSNWITILDGNDLSIDEVTTEPLLNGALSTEASYLVHIRAMDTMGRTADSFTTIPTDKVYWHRDGARNALGLGKYNEKDNAVDSAWDFYMNGNKITGLPDPIDDTDAVSLGFLKSFIGDK